MGYSEYFISTRKNIKLEKLAKRLIKQINKKNLDSELLCSTITFTDIKVTQVRIFGNEYYLPKIKIKGRTQGLMIRSARSDINNCFTYCDKIRYGIKIIEVDLIILSCNDENKYKNSYCDYFLDKPIVVNETRYFSKLNNIF